MNGDKHNVASECDSAVMALPIHLPAHARVIKRNGIDCCKTGSELRLHLLMKPAFPSVTLHPNPPMVRDLSCGEKNNCSG